MSVKYISNDDLLSSWQMVLLGLLVGGAAGVLYLVLTYTSNYLCTTRLVVNNEILMSMQFTYMVVIAVLPWIIAIRYRANIGFFHRFTIFGITYALLVSGCIVIGVGFSRGVAYMLGNLVLIGMILLTGLMWNVTLAWTVVWICCDRIKVAAPGQCGSCGYDLSGLDSERCPECGRGFDRSQQTADLS